MKKRSFAGWLSGLLAVSALAAPPIYAQGATPAMAAVALGFETMAGCVWAICGSGGSDPQYCGRRVAMDHLVRSG